MPRLRAALFTAAVAAAGTALAAPAPGPMTVVASTAPDIPPGHVVRPGDNLEVPGGATVQLFTLSGREIVLTGPFAGFPGAEGEPPSETKLQILTQILFGASEMSVGWPGAGRVTLDAVAGAGLLAGGTWCIVPEQETRLSLPEVADGRTGVLLSLDDGRTAEVVWPAGATSVPWPADLPPADGAQYRLTFADATGEVFVLRLLEAAENGAARIAQLGAAGCSAQLATALAELSASEEPVPPDP